jgi:hypothetical protein
MSLWWSVKRRSRRDLKDAPRSVPAGVTDKKQYVVIGKSSSGIAGRSFEKYKGLPRDVPAANAYKNPFAVDTNTRAVPTPPL